MMMDSSVFLWQAENVLMKRSKYGKVKATKKNDITNIGLVSKKLKISGDKVKASDLIYLPFFRSLLSYIKVLPYKRNST